jgi:hypothetical protein
MRSISAIIFNPALLHFLVIIGLLNLGANLLHWFGVADLDLARASEVSAMGFVIAVIYTAIFERNAARPK